MPRLRLALAQTNPVSATFRATRRRSSRRARGPAGAPNCRGRRDGALRIPDRGPRGPAQLPARGARRRRRPRQAARRRGPRRPCRRGGASRRTLRTPVARHQERAHRHRPELRERAAPRHVLARYAKHHLPNYSVFDEYRIFIPGDELLVLRLKGADVALIICEDLWRDGGPVGRVLESMPACCS